MHISVINQLSTFTCGALIAHRYTYAPPRCRTSLYRRTFIPSQYLSGRIWLTDTVTVDPVFDGVRLAGFKSRCLFVGLVGLSFFVFNYFPFLFFSSIGWLCGAGVFGLIGCQSSSPGLALPIFFNNNKLIIIN